MRITIGTIGFACALALAGATAPAGAQQKFVSIGTGGVTGVYYPAGGAICRLVNKDRKKHGLRCSAESTGGSIANLTALRDGDLEFGVAQSDAQFNAFNGEGAFAKDGAFEGLRSVFALYPEPVTVMARADADIDGVGDLKGKRVNIGNPGSGTRETWDVLEAALGWQRSDLRLASEMKAAGTGQALCDDKFDAYVYLVGHPSALIQETLQSCDSHIVPVTGPTIDKLVAQYPYYRKATIADGLYGSNPEIDTYGVGATFVTSAETPADTVYTVVKAVFDNFKQFRSLHPAFAYLKEKEMLADGLTAPLHEGAVRYYKERGWM